MKACVWWPAWWRNADRMESYGRTAGLWIMEIRWSCERKVEDNNFWWAHQDSNLGPTDYESGALTN